MKNFSKIIVCMFILTSLFFYCSTAKADDSDSNVIELYDYETGQTSNISISDYSINFLPASGIIVDTPIPTKIIGTDNQWQAPKGEYPFTSIMFLAILYDSGRIATGTGFLVGSNVMATAGHNFKTTENGYLETATQMRIFPTMDDLSPDMIESLDDFKGEWCYPKSWFSGRGSSVPTSSYSNANDLAIVKIRKNYGDQYGYFGVTSSGPDYPGVNIAGYPSNPLKSYHIYAAYDLVKDYTNTVINYYTDTEGGQSGSPVYNAYSDESTSSEPKPIAIGIHIKGIPNIGYNTGRKFDSTLISYIEYMRTN